jgi:hypothetical protein
MSTARAERLFPKYCTAINAHPSPVALWPREEKPRRGDGDGCPRPRLICETWEPRASSAVAKPGTPAKRVNRGVGECLLLWQIKSPLVLCLPCKPRSSWPLAVGTEIALFAFLFHDKGRRSYRCPCAALSNFSPAGIATNSRFSFGASGHVAYEVTAQGGL